MKKPFNPSGLYLAGAALLAALAAFPISSHAGPDTATNTARELDPITIKRTRNPGDLPYVYFQKNQVLLESFLPSEPRVIDMRFRLSFTDITGPERDEYLPDSWAVAIVGDTIDHTIDVARGGYFLLPALELAEKEKATVMFNARTRKSYLNVAWKFRIAEGQTLSYADFARAFDEVAVVQKKIPWYRIGLRDERAARFDGLKACFHPGEGRIDIDGQPAAARTQGSCLVLKFDSALAKSGNAKIAFIGALDIVTLHEAGAEG